MLKEAVDAIYQAWEEGHTLIAYNAAYDHSVLRVLTGDFTVNGPVFDPFIIDRVKGKWRKGKRTLEEDSAHYGVELSNEHEAAADALAAPAWPGSKCASISPELAQMGTNELMEYQAVGWYKDGESFKKYLEGRGRDASDVSTAWPMIS